MLQMIKVANQIISNHILITLIKLYITYVVSLTSTSLTCYLGFVIRGFDYCGFHIVYQN
jgi:hypothetical protein